MKKVVFQTELLPCPSCMNTIEMVLKKQPGVGSAKVLFHSGKVRVSFDESIMEVQGLEDIITQLGYPVLSRKVS